VYKGSEQPPNEYVLAKTDVTAAIIVPLYSKLKSHKYLCMLKDNFLESHRTSDDKPE